MSLEVKLQVFEGPLDLLLHLIKEAKLDNDTPVEETLKKNEPYEFLIIKEEDEDGKVRLVGEES